MEGKFICVLVILIWALTATSVYVLICIMREVRALQKTIKDIIESDYKTIERNAEAALAEEYDDPKQEGPDNSLYKNKEGKYSYKAFAENKKKQEKAKSPESYIDDFEKAAVKAERNMYGR